EGTSRPARPARGRADYALDAMERATESRKPVVLYVSTQSDDRRYARARELCGELERTLFGDYRTATVMQDFTLVRVNLEDLETQTIRRYGITPRVAPQLLIYNFQLRRLSSMQ